MCRRRGVAGPCGHARGEVCAPWNVFRHRPRGAFHMPSSTLTSRSASPSSPRAPAHPSLEHRIGHALEALRQGRAVVLLDDDERENEADLVVAAERLDEALMALLIRECSGIVCLCLPEAVAERLGLAPMVARNECRHGTAFTVSID